MQPASRTEVKAVNHSLVVGNETLEAQARCQSAMSLILTTVQLQSTSDTDGGRPGVNLHSLRSAFEEGLAKIRGLSVLHRQALEMGWPSSALLRTSGPFGRFSASDLGVFYGLVSVMMASWGNDMSPCMVVEINHHGSYDLSAWLPLRTAEVSMSLKPQ